MARSCIVWLTLSAYLFLALGGATVVLCEGADGHSGIELAHGEGSCKNGVGDAGGGPVIEGISSPACEDTSFETLLSAERILPRSNPADAVLLPAPLLPQWAWTSPQPKPSEQIVPARASAAPSHLDVVQSVVLLI